MTGKDKLAEWIKNASIGEIVRNLHGCPITIGLTRETDCGITSCASCLQTAIEKEYPGGS